MEKYNIELGRYEMEDCKQIILGTGASSTKDYSELLEIVKTAIKSGIYRFDTAPSYQTEEILVQAIREVTKELKLKRENVYIQTKIDAWQMQESNGDIQRYVEEALKKMDVSYLDALLIHWPIPEYFEETWKAFVKLQDEQIVSKIGICNVRVRQLENLAKNDFLPQIVQIERNPLFTCENEVEFCKEHNIIIQAYSPLCKMNERIKENRELKGLAEKYKKSVGQIVLRWHLDTGVMPIFTSRKQSRIQEYSDIFDFQLTSHDIKIVSDLNINYKMYLESFACPGF